MNSKKLVTILVHALIGWALCAATMGIGMASTSLQNTLIAPGTHLQLHTRVRYPNSDV